MNKKKILYMPLHRSVVDRDIIEKIETILLKDEKINDLEGWWSIKRIYDMLKNDKFFGGKNYIIFKLIVEYWENDGVIYSTKILGYINSGDIKNPYKRGGVGEFKHIPNNEEDWRKFLSYFPSLDP